MKSITLTLSLTVGILLLIGAFLYSISPAQAEPSHFDRAQTSSATTTLNFLKPGFGTTTLTFMNPLDTGFNSAVVAIQANATNTTVVGQVVLNARVEGSPNSTNGTDGEWYPVAIPVNTTLAPFTPTSASTTVLTSNPYQIFQIALSTSTTPARNYGGTGSDTLLMTSFSIPTDFKHMRVVFTDPTGGGNYGIWAEIIAKKENN